MSPSQTKTSETESKNYDIKYVILEILFFIPYFIVFWNINYAPKEIHHMFNYIEVNKTLFIIITMPNSPIPVNMSRYFVSDLNRMSGYKAIYLDWKDVNKTNPENSEDILNLKVPEYYRIITSKITPNWSYNKKSIDIFRKTYFGLSYFYYETNYRWLHRGTDDNAINLKLLDSYFDSLEEKYNPLKDPLIFGSCVKIPDFRIPGFLQGGVGYLYSRRAVELMLPIYKQVIYNCKWAEDICHDEFLTRLNITLLEATSFNFLGHPLPDDDLERLDKNDFSDLNPCPQAQLPKKPDQCALFSAPLNKIVFLHHHDKKGIEGVIKRCKQIFAVKNETVHFYFPDLLWPRLCRDNPYT